MGRTSMSMIFLWSWALWWSMLGDGHGGAEAGHHQHDSEAEAAQDDLERKWGHEWAFSGISTFAHLEHVKCLTHPDEPFDIGIIGAPFDTAVSYRPGARFGPRAIRAASARQTSFRGFNARAMINPYMSWARILDCGDIPVSPFDNALALKQMSAAFYELGSHPVAYGGDPGQPHVGTEKTTKVPKASSSGSMKDSTGPRPRPRPKLITLGGDHSIALAALRALCQIYGQAVAVVHFDAHLDTWDPSKFPNAWASEQSAFNHGSMFWLASQEGLILNSSSVHAGLRTRLSGADAADYADDERQGFLRLSSDDIDDVGTAGIVKAIRNRIGPDTPTYLSVDIDVLEPGLAPGTGTPEPGGWTPRELIRVLRGIADLNVVGADVVEVAPAYDSPGEVTALAAAQVVYEIVTSLVQREVRVRKEESAGMGEGAGVVRDEL